MQRMVDVLHTYDLDPNSPFAQPQFTKLIFQRNSSRLGRTIYKHLLVRVSRIGYPVLVVERPFIWGVVYQEIELILFEDNP